MQIFGNIVVIKMEATTRAVPMFVKIEGVRKLIRCSDCGRRIEIANFNRKRCKECERRS